MANRGLALGVAALLALAACSSDAEADPEETQADTTSTDPEGTAPIDTPAPTTATPAETEPPVATDAPTTTVDEAAIIADVEAAYFAGLDAYYAALADPADQQLRETLALHYTANGREFVLDTIDALAAANRIARPHPSLEPQAIITGEVRFENEDRSEASLVACELLPQAIYELGAGPNGEDALLRDDVLRTDIVVVLRYEDGKWRIAGGESIRELVGVDTCDT